MEDSLALLLFAALFHFLDRDKPVASRKNPGSGGHRSFMEKPVRGAEAGMNAVYMPMFAVRRPVYSDSLTDVALSLVDERN